MQSSTTVVCMVAVSIGGAAIVVAMLDRGSLHLWLGGIMPSGMSSCGFGAVRYGRSRGIWGSPGFCVGWRAAVRGGGVDCCFAGLFCYWWRSIHFGGGTGHWAIILWSLGSVLRFPNFLRS